MGGDGEERWEREKQIPKSESLAYERNVEREMILCFLSLNHADCRALQLLW
ncbi:hypothetical protein AVEN_193030-1, partial [Araneus ventricosus]